MHKRFDGLMKNGTSNMIFKNELNAGPWNSGSDLRVAQLWRAVTSRYNVGYISEGAAFKSRNGAPLAK
jgi:hypothetical protein